jgi:excisionase family DNA binding protein
VSVDAAIREALVAALGSPEGQAAIRRAVVGERPSTSGDDRAYSVAQVAERSGFSTETILQHIADGNLRGTKPRGCREWRVRAEDFRAWLDGGDEHVDEQKDPEAVALAMLAGRSR